MKRKKVGIMGGTFDPIHTGHLIIAQQALYNLKLDMIWFMPAGDPPHKGDEVSNKEHRLNMVKLAIEGNDKFELFTYEVDKDRPSYSAITMTELDEKYPDIDFYFIMGADSLLNFHKWYHPEVICEHTSLVVANRDDVPVEQLKQVSAQLSIDYGARIYLLDTPQIEISSSSIRAIKDSALRRYMVPENVFKYMIDNKLYN